MNNPELDSAVQAAKAYKAIVRDAEDILEARRHDAMSLTRSDVGSDEEYDQQRLYLDACAAAALELLDTAVNTYIGVEQAALRTISALSGGADQ